VLLARAAAALDVPPLRARVNDLAGVLPPERAQALEARLARFEQETSHQIVVLTVPTLGDDALEDFSIRVADAWKVGQKGVDNGAIVLVVPQDRKARIEMGRGLQGVIPDVIASRILRDRMIPRFRDGDYARGIEDGVAALESAARGEVIPEAQRPSREPGHEPLAVALFAGLFGAIFATPLRHGRLRPLSALVAAAIAGVVAWVVLALVPWSALAGGFGALLGFALPGPGATRRGGFGRRGGWSPGGWSGGGWGGGGGWSGGGGGGGFSGGGGGFDGGGASGSW
jgi:uncharacterized protein